MPLGALREIIRHGGESLASFYQERVQKPLVDRVGDVRSKTESLREDIEQRMRGVTGMFRKEGEGATNPVKEVMAAGERAVDELRGRMDTAVKSVVETLGGPAAAEIDRLQKRIQDLEKRIAELTKET
jgi:polyhydroxyalkanoate synthesis regulator phasin